MEPLRAPDASPNLAAFYEAVAVVTLSTLAEFAPDGDRHAFMAAVGHRLLEHLNAVIKDTSGSSRPESLAVKASMPRSTPPRPNRGRCVP
jgi:hypothetical protein